MKKCQCLIRLLIFCIIACFVVSVDGFFYSHCEAISFDEVPEVIRQIVLREIGDVPIRDVDREKEDGETVQKILENRSVEERYDYDSIFSEKMPVFWRIKDQLKLVSLGDSRGEAGVRAEMFYGEENRKTPVAYNLAISGGPLEFQEIVVVEKFHSIS